LGRESSKRESSKHVQKLDFDDAKYGIEPLPIWNGVGEWSSVLSHGAVTEPVDAAADRFVIGLALCQIRMSVTALSTGRKITVGKGERADMEDIVLRAASW
jgi:hypothetical protein